MDFTDIDSTRLGCKESMIQYTPSPVVGEDEDDIRFAFGWFCRACVMAHNGNEEGNEAAFHRLAAAASSSSITFATLAASACLPAAVKWTFFGS